MKNNFKKLGIKVLSMSLACFSLFGAINSTQAMGGRKGKGRGGSSVQIVSRDQRASQIKVTKIEFSIDSPNIVVTLHLSDNTVAVCFLSNKQMANDYIRAAYKLYPNAEMQLINCTGKQPVVRHGDRWLFKCGGILFMTWTVVIVGYNMCVVCSLNNVEVAKLLGITESYSIFSVNDLLCSDCHIDFKASLVKEKVEPLAAPFPVCVQKRNAAKNTCMTTRSLKANDVKSILVVLYYAQAVDTSLMVSLVELRLADGMGQQSFFPLTLGAGDGLYMDVVKIYAYVNQMKKIYPAAEVYVQDFPHSSEYLLLEPGENLHIVCDNGRVIELQWTDDRQWVCKALHDSKVIEECGKKCDSPAQASFSASCALREYTEEIKEAKKSKKEEIKQEERARKREEARKKKEKEEEEKIQAEEARKEREEELEKARKEELAREAKEQRHQEERAKSEAEKRMEEQKRREAKALAKEAKKKSSGGSKESPSSGSGSSSASSEDETEATLTEE